MDEKLRLLLWLCVAAMCLAGTALLATAARTRHHRGVRWWIGAIASGATGLGLAAAGAGTYWAWFPIHALVAQWPLLTLIGLRLFHARTELPGAATVDKAVLWICLTLLAGAEALVPAGPLREACAVVLALVMHLYPAAVALRCRATSEGKAVKGLGLVWLVSALAPLGLGLGGFSVSMVWHASAAAMVPGTMLMAGMAAVLLIQRHQHAEALLGQFPQAAHSAPSHQDASVFNAWARYMFERDGHGAGMVMLIGARFLAGQSPTSTPGAPNSATDGYQVAPEAAHRLVQCSRHVIRKHDVAAQPELGTVAVLLPKAKPLDALAVGQRIALRWKLLAEPKPSADLRLAFGMARVLPEEDLAEALDRAHAALAEARRPGQGSVVEAEGDALHRVFQRHQLDGRQAA